MTNDGQLPMMKSMLMSAMKSGFNMSEFHCYVISSKKSESAAYNTSEFKSLTTRKLELILENMMAHELVMWVDNDIHFFQDCTADVLSKTGNFIMQNDLWSPCTGFFLVWSNPKTISHIKRAIEFLRTNTNPHINDQHAFKACMNPIRSFDRIYLLDTEQYPNGEIYFNQKITSKARMVHCNFLTKTSEKVQRLKQHGLWDESDEAFYKANIIFI
jgi:hypothetical protein